jgi:hypothetical protein
MKRLFLAFFLVSSPVAAKPACDQLAGSVMFSDMAYGIVAGALLSGLYLVAADDYEDSDRKIAGAALGTGAIGAGVGVMELALRECPSTSLKLQSSHRNWRPLVVANSKEVMGGLSFSW